MHMDESAQADHGSRGPLAAAEIMPESVCWIRPGRGQRGLMPRSQWESEFCELVRRTTASGVCSALLLATIAKRNIDLRPAAIRAGGTTVIAVRKCHASLEFPNTTVHVYFTGLIGIGPCQGERYGLALVRKRKWLFIWA